MVVTQPEETAEQRTARLRAEQFKADVQTTIGGVLREQQAQLQAFQRGEFGPEFREEQQFQTFESEGRQLRFNPETGQLEDIGEAQFAFRTSGELVDPGVIFGITGTGERRQIGVSERRDPIQQNVVLGASSRIPVEGSPGEFRAPTQEEIQASREQVGADVQESLAATAERRAPFQVGQLSGQQKLERFGFIPEMRGGIVGISEGRTRTTAELFDLDFADQVRQANAAGAPRQGRNEDPRDFQIRVLQFNLRNIESAFNENKAGFEKKLLKDALDRQKEAFVGLGRQAKSQNQLRGEAETNPAINQQFNQAIQFIESNVNAFRDAEIERKTRFLTGSKAARRVATEAIRKEQNQKAELEKKRLIAKAKDARKVLQDLFVSSNITNQADIKAEIKRRKTLTPKQLRAEEEEQERNTIIQEYRGKINPKTGQLFTALEAKAQAGKIIREFGKDPEAQNAFAEFSDAVASGQVDTRNLTALFESARGFVGNDNTEAMKLMTALTSLDIAKEARKEWLSTSPFTPEDAQSIEDIENTVEEVQEILNGGSSVSRFSILMDSLPISQARNLVQGILAPNSRASKEMKDFAQSISSFVLGPPEAQRGIRGVARSNVGTVMDELRGRLERGELNAAEVEAEALRAGLGVSAAKAVDSALTRFDRVIGDFISRVDLLPIPEEPKGEFIDGIFVAAENVPEEEKEGFLSRAIEGIKNLFGVEQEEQDADALFDQIFDEVNQ